MTEEEKKALTDKLEELAKSIFEDMIVRHSDQLGTLPAAQLMTVIARLPIMMIERMSEQARAGSLSEDDLRQAFIVYLGIISSQVTHARMIF